MNFSIKDIYHMTITCKKQGTQEETTILKIWFLNFKSSRIRNELFIIKTKICIKSSNNGAMMTAALASGAGEIKLGLHGCRKVG